MLIYSTNGNKNAVFNTDFVSSITCEYTELPDGKYWDIVVCDLTGNKHILKRYFKNPSHIMYAFKQSIEHKEDSFNFQ